MAPSGASPIATAPRAARAMRVLMVKGRPSRALAHALRASGATPMRVAAVKPQAARLGKVSARSALTVRSAPVTMTKRPLGVRCQARSGASGAGAPAPASPPLRSGG